MNDCLNDLTNERAVNQAIEDNMFSYWMNYGRLEGREVFEDERLMDFFTGVPFPLFNAVFRAQLTVNQIEPTIGEIVQKSSQRKSPLFWWTGPQTLPSDLGIHLQKLGFNDAGYTSGMAIELSSLPESVPVPDDLQIEVVDNEEALRQWIDVLATGFDIPPTLISPTYELEAGLGMDTPHRYLAKLNGKPVGSIALHFDAGVAGIYAVATKPEARGQGIGAAVTLRALLDARDMGYHVGILQASTMGYRVYKRLGFKDFCQLDLYYFEPK